MSKEEEMEEIKAMYPIGTVVRCANGIDKGSYTVGGYRYKRKGCVYGYSADHEFFYLECEDDIDGNYIYATIVTPATSELYEIY